MRALLLLLACTLASCATRHEFPAPDSFDSRAQVYRGQERILFQDMLDELARADAVFLGEYHDDETTHQIEQFVYEGLLSRRGGRVVLAMEMFERDTQKALDRYLAGNSSESEFLVDARAWHNYRTGYRAMIEVARARGLPVVASNAPRSLARRISRGKAEAFRALEGDEKNWLAPDLRANSVEYWQRFSRAVRGHIVVDDVRSEGLLYSVQSLWDNTMGYSCAEALAKHPGWSVFHVNGGFHSRDHDGTVHQFKLRSPNARVLTIDVRPVTDLAYLDTSGAEVHADYTIYAKRRGRDRKRGRFAVATAGRMEFRLHVPENASDTEKVPLLVWLPDDGGRTEDVLSYWRQMLGDAVAIAVVEPTHRQRQDRLYVAGQWYWPESFFEDLGPATLGLLRLQDYIRTHYPVADRTVLVGEGTGATVTIQAAIGGAEDLAAALAFRPRNYVKFRETSLPDPRKDAAGRPLVEIYTEGPGYTWWQQEAETYRTVAHELAVHEIGGSLDLRARVEEALGVESESPKPPILILAAGFLDDSEPAPSWARVVAAAVAGKDRQGVLARLDELPGLLAELGSGVLDGARVLAFAHEEPPAGFEPFRAVDLDSGTGIPLAPGDFGGTTVLVTPAGLSGEAFEAWHALEVADVLKKRSRFHHLRVARGPTALPAVLQDLISKGRSNVLIVPASFCVPATTMRELEAVASDYQDQLQIHWLPGLGAELARLFQR